MIVEAVRQGQSLRAVARQYRVSLPTVQRWVRRAEGLPLDEVSWAGRSSRPLEIRRTPKVMEDRVLRCRERLRDRSDLGEYGARAIHQELVARRVAQVPSVRTIGRILERRGALDSRRRVRRPPPPRGWYLPRVAALEAEVDLWDGVEGLVFSGGFDIDVLTAVSLCGGVVGAWPCHPALTSRFVSDCLIAHWQALGLPDYAQFDNDSRFTGANIYPNIVGQVIRLCLGLQVVPVFAPPRETGFMAAIESFNARWQAKVWERFYHESLPTLCKCSERYVAACRRQRAPRIESAPARRPFPRRWRFDENPTPSGMLIYLRRTDQHGKIQILGHPFLVDRSWPHRLVRCEVCLPEGQLRFYGLRRREPELQPLLNEAVHEFDIRSRWK